MKHGSQKSRNSECSQRKNTSIINMRENQKV